MMRSERHRVGPALLNQVSRTNDLCIEGDPDRLPVHHLRFGNAVWPVALDNTGWISEANKIKAGVLIRDALTLEFGRPSRDVS